ncbi:hypothetical protein NPIL_356221 [Nephila pilipes]|uniref:Uncharacterized protein n=1 Tax=Nephila pilipes TaxID=299642 RepID=A0A8X6QLH8_NEPPI|nr:hypothetical protein NPIL_356221 [Nephila pilipes]
MFRPPSFTPPDSNFTSLVKLYLIELLSQFKVIRICERKTVQRPSFDHYLLRSRFLKGAQFRSFCTSRLFSLLIKQNVGEGRVPSCQRQVCALCHSGWRKSIEVTPVGT